MPVPPTPACAALRFLPRLGILPHRGSSRDRPRMPATSCVLYVSYRIVSYRVLYCIVCCIVSCVSYRILYRIVCIVSINMIFIKYLDELFKFEHFSC